MFMKLPLQYNWVAFGQEGRDRGVCRVAVSRWIPCVCVPSAHLCGLATVLSLINECKLFSHGVFLKQLEYLEHYLYRK